MGSMYGLRRGSTMRCELSIRGCTVEDLRVVRSGRVRTEWDLDSGPRVRSVCLLENKDKTRSYEIISSKHTKATPNRTKPPETNGYTDGRSTHRSMPGGAVAWFLFDGNVVRRARGERVGQLSYSSLVTLAVPARQ